MNVASIMSSEVVTVRPDEALMTIHDQLHTMGFHHLLVEEEGRLVGVISDRDVLRIVSPFLDTAMEQQRDVNTLVREARDVMTPHPVTVRPETSIERAASLMLSHDISGLPVVSAEGAVAGIVTAKDILRYAAQASSGAAPAEAVKEAHKAFKRR